MRRIDPESQEFVQPQNVRRIVRALEVYQATGKPFSYWRTKEPPQFDWLALGLRLSREELYARIDARVEAMFEAGFVEEVRALREGVRRRAAGDVGHRLRGDRARYLDGEMTLERGGVPDEGGTHRFARHQAAWFKASDQRIHWLDPGTAVAGRTVGATVRGMSGEIIVITGIQGAGKSTVGRLLAAEYERGVHIEADVLQRMVVSGGAWVTDAAGGPGTPTGEAARQLRLRLHNACLLARSFAEAGFTVVLDEIILGERYDELRRGAGGRAVPARGAGAGGGDGDRARCGAGQDGGRGVGGLPGPCPAGDDGRPRAVAQHDTPNGGGDGGRDHVAVAGRGAGRIVEMVRPNKIKYTVILQPETDPDFAGYFNVSVPALSGCFTYGATREEALANAREAIEAFLEDLEAHGEEIPAEHLETVGVEI